MEGDEDQVPWAMEGSSRSVVAARGRHAHDHAGHSGSCGHSHGHDHDQSHDHDEDHDHEHERDLSDHHHHHLASPLTSAAEFSALTSTLSSFYLYRRTAHLNLTHRRRTAFFALPRRYKGILGGGPDAAVDYLGVLRNVDEAIDRNSEVAERIFGTGLQAFGLAESVQLSSHGREEKSEGGKGDKKNGKGWWETSASSEDMEKVKSTLKQFYRDWAAEGIDERRRCYGPVLEELCSRFPLYGKKLLGKDGEVKRRGKRRDKVRVLVPGAGLGRLAFDIVVAGFECQGNEFSYHQLVGSNWVLNCTTKANEFTLHPWIHTFSHHLTRENHLRSVQIPDVHPGTLLLSPASSTSLPSNPYADEVHDPPPERQPNGESAHGDGNNEGFSPASTRFSMIAGDFLQCYPLSPSPATPVSPHPNHYNTFDACTTVFFIDTAPNVVAYVEAIYNLLAPGGVWINLGPLLWHWEGRDPPGDADGEAGGIGEEGGGVELSAEEVVRVVEAVGFRVVKRGGEGGGAAVGGEGFLAGMGIREVKTGYIQDERSLLNYEYRAMFWVAVKPGGEDGEEDAGIGGG
ncbi:N2227-like protein-domain-containing protein [Kalaharituber pfeilii]|nr:N2227-like protein-domain-containing protein [Kalaharituber pfeilii]